MIQNGTLKEKAAGNRHGFHIPLILDEKPFQDGRYFFAPLAQLEKHSTFKRVAVGSSPTGAIVAIG